LTERKKPVRPIKRTKSVFGHHFRQQRGTGCADRTGKKEGEEVEQDRAPVDSAAEKETTDQEELRDRMTLEHTADEYDKYLNAVVPPVFLNSLHAYSCEDDYRKVDIFSNETFVYARDSNPTVSILERKIAELEHGCRAVVFSSGMAAFTSLFLRYARREATSSA
jgi:hypothetical protein